MYAELQSPLKRTPMKKITLALVSLTFVFALTACDDGGENTDYRAAMVSFVKAIAERGRTTAGADFGIFPQNGQALTAGADYLAVMTGSGNEEVFYGYDGDDVMTPPEVTAELTGYMDPQVTAGKLVMVCDYCTTPAKVDDSYDKCAAHGYIGYVAVRDLDEIVDNGHVPTAADSHDCQTWSDVEHYLYIIDTSKFASAEAFVNAVDGTYYDLVIIDAFYEDSQLTTEQINRLKTKPDGKRRRVLAYMSIGEAEDYRWYWQSGWGSGNPPFIDAENPDWPGNYAVRYWDAAWQAIIFEYLDKINSAGFDGVYLDKIDEYEYFEDGGY